MATHEFLAREQSTRSAFLGGSLALLLVGCNKSSTPSRSEIYPYYQNQAVENLPYVKGEVNTVRSHTKWFFIDPTFEISEEKLKAAIEYIELLAKAPPLLRGRTQGRIFAASLKPREHVERVLLFSSDNNPKPPWVPELKPTAGRLPNQTWLHYFPVPQPDKTLILDDGIYARPEEALSRALIEELCVSSYEVTGRMLVQPPRLIIKQDLDKISLKDACHSLSLAYSMRQQGIEYATYYFGLELRNTAAEQHYMVLGQKEYEGIPQLGLPVNRKTS